MSALLKKEIRLLLPSFIIASVLAGSFWLIPKEVGPGLGFRELLPVLGFLLCPMMMVVMALSSFGREISSGTFADLLSQPVPRERVWWTKTLLLGIALAVVAVVWRLSFLRYLAGSTYEGLKPEALGTGLFALVAYSGGLWTVLLLRQVGAAFWFTLLVPGLFVALVSGMTRNHPGRTEFALAVVLIPYALAGFWWARRLFLRAEDYHWTGGTIVLPGVRRWRGALGRGGWRRQFRPCAALLVKEFQLHQSQVLIAGLLALLHLGVLAARRFGDPLEPAPLLDVLTDHFWVLWLVLPVLVGCAAVAEERKLGTLESQLCLPVKRRTQLVIKFAFVLLASILLGVVAPLLLEGRRILPETEASTRARLTEEDLQMPGSGVIQRTWTRVEACRAVVSPVLPFVPMLAGVVALLAIACYASTLARSTLQALAPAALGIVATGVLFALCSQMEYLFRHPPWRGWLVYILGVPVMLPVLAGLALWNFKRVLVGWPVWRRNGLVCFGALALVGATTSAIYHRAWELAGPLEPPHGPAVLAPAQGVFLRADGWNLVAQLPGGRIWMGRFWGTFPSVRALVLGDVKISSVLGAGRRLDGSNWASVVACHRDVIGIKQDGSLWVSEKPENWRQFWRLRTNPSLEPTPLVQVGRDHNWQSVTGASPPVFLLKTDGTLWQWGRGFFDVWRWDHGQFDRIKGRPGLRAFEPERVGTDSDWAEISWNRGQFEFRKRDGRTLGQAL